MDNTSRHNDEEQNDRKKAKIDGDDPDADAQCLAESKNVKQTLTREAWMTQPSSRNIANVVNESTSKETLLGKSARELNPYWSENGTGLPKQSSAPDNRKMMRPETSTNASVKMWQHEPKEENKLSNEERNKLYARMIKAEIMGDKALYEQLKTRLEKHTVTYSKGDIPSGTMMHVTTNVEAAEKALHKHHRHDPHTKKKNDLAIPTLQDILHEEKLSNETPDEVFARQIMKNSNFKNSLDDMDERSQDLALKSTRDPEKLRDKLRLSNARKHNNVRPCHYCEAPQTLISASHHWMLIFPKYQSPISHSVTLIPVVHAASTVAMDEDALEELRNFKKCLLHMYNSMQLGAIFIETVVSQKKHTKIECVPIPVSLLERVRICFTKAINEEGDVESNNRKLIPFSQSKYEPVGMIPPHFSYFSVEFGLGQGLIHPIENEKAFSRFFAYEVIGGLLNIEPVKWRQPMRLSSDVLEKDIKKFSAIFEPFDWTKLLQVNG